MKYSQVSNDVPASVTLVANIECPKGHQSLPDHTDKWHMVIGEAVLEAC